MLGGPEHRPSQRVRSEHGLVNQVLGDHRRLVVRPGDLLHDDTPFAVKFVLIDAWACDEVGQQVGRLKAAGGARGDVEGDEIVARVGVQH